MLKSNKIDKANVNNQTSAYTLNIKKKKFLNKYISSVLLFAIIMSFSIVGRASESSISQKNQNDVIALKKQLDRNKSIIKNLKKKKANLKKNTAATVSLNEKEKKILNDYWPLDSYKAVRGAKYITGHQSKWNEKVVSTGLKADMCYPWDGGFDREISQYLYDKGKYNWPPKDTDRINPYLNKCIASYDRFSTKKINNEDRAIMYQAFLAASKNLDLIINIRKKNDIIQSSERASGEHNERVEDLNERIKKAQKASARLEHVIALKTNQKSPKTLNDYALLYNSSTDDSYTSTPLIDGPSKERYYEWSGNLTTKEDGLYIVWNVNYNPIIAEANASQNVMYIDPVSSRGFAFKDIKRKFDELRQGGAVTVIGKYTSNTTITLANGEKKLIPVLTDCYVK